VMGKEMRERERERERDEMRDFKEGVRVGW